MFLLSLQCTQREDTVTHFSASGARHYHCKKSNHFSVWNLGSSNSSICRDHFSLPPCWDSSCCSSLNNLHMGVVKGYSMWTNVWSWVTPHRGNIHTHMFSITWLHIHQIFTHFSLDEQKQQLLETMSLIPMFASWFSLRRIKRHLPRPSMVKSVWKTKHF